MKLVKTSFDRHEDRRDRRYPLPPLVVVIDGVDYATVNWSLGGFLISGFTQQQLAIGSPIVGHLRVEGVPTPLRFSGSAVRVGPEPGFLAVQFHELGENGIEILDRCIARRMFRRGGASA